MSQLLDRFCGYFEEKTVGAEVAARNKGIALISLIGFSGLTYLFVSRTFLRKRVAVNEQAALQKRQRPFSGTLKEAHILWLKDRLNEFHLADISKALRMTLDYAVQDLTEEELFAALQTFDPASGLGENPAGEQSYVLDVSHIQWIEKTVEAKGFTSPSALVDYAISQVQQIDAALVFEIERSHKRARDTSFLFSIKS